MAIYKVWKVGNCFIQSDAEECVDFETTWGGDDRSIYEEGFAVYDSNGRYKFGQVYSTLEEAIEAAQELNKEDGGDSTVEEFSAEEFAYLRCIKGDLRRQDLQVLKEVSVLQSVEYGCDMEGINHFLGFDLETRGEVKWFLIHADKVLIYKDLAIDAEESSLWG